MVRAARANQTANYSRTHKPVIRALGAANHWFAPRKTSVSSRMRGIHSYPGFMNFCSITIRYDQHQARRMEPKTVACRLPVACSQLSIRARELRTWSAYLVSVKSQIFENAVEHQLKVRNVAILNVAGFCRFTKLHFRRWIAQFHCIWSLDSLIHTPPRVGAQGTLTKSIA